MRTFSTLILVSTLVCAGPVMAGAGHDHNPDGSHAVGPINSGAAIKRAELHVNSMVKRGKLDKSWEGAKSTGATQQDFGKGPEWVVSFKNDKVSDVEKQNLYVFYTLTGHYLATNFTGK